VVGEKKEKVPCPHLGGEQKGGRTKKKKKGF
jgi:hypothetical protein